MDEHAVVIAGGGPTGLMLAAELALADVDVVIVERRADQELDGSRAGGLHARTMEVLDQRGVADRFRAAGQEHPHVGFGQISLEISDFPTRHNYLLALWQRDFERIMADWVDELEVPILRGRQVVGFVQDAGGVVVELSDGTSLRAQYLVGCDGGRSLVRRTAGIDFPGLDPSTSFLIAEVAMEREPEIGMRPEGGGIGPVDPAAGSGPYRVVLREQPDESADEPTLQELREALVNAYGTDFGVHSPTWISRFTDATRQAAFYRHGRVLLAGDAAHVHAPHGGQGLNTGVQDAVNLGWKLAQVIDGVSPDSLLDTYHAERHPVGARVLHNTMAQVALSSPDERHQALRDTMTELLRLEGPRRHMAAMVSGLDIHYDLGGGHPMVGRRVPDLDVRTADGPTRVYAMLHDARPVLLALAGSDGFDLTLWAPRIQKVQARHDGPWELPVIGEVSAPTAVLIRPDGYVAWVGDPTDPALPAVITTGSPPRLAERPEQLILLIVIMGGGDVRVVHTWRRDRRARVAIGSPWEVRVGESVVGQVAALWDGQAASFDDEPDHGLHDVTVRRAWADRLRTWLPEPPADLVDLGCGTGSLSVLLAGLGYGVVGVDVSRQMIQRACTKAEAAGVPATFHLADATAPPVEPASVDVVLVRHLVWTLPDPHAAIANWVGLLRRGGVLVMVEGRWAPVGSEASEHDQEPDGSRGVIPWYGGVGAGTLAAAVRPWVAELVVHDLAVDEQLWGRPVADERFALVAQALPE